MFLSTLLSFASDTLFAYMRSNTAIGGFLQGDFNVESVLPLLHKRKDTGEIWDFLSHFKSGVMKANRYRLEFSLPKGCSGSNVNDVNQFSRTAGMKAADILYNRNGSINIKAHTVTFPQRTFQTFEVRHNSAPFRLPYTNVYDPVTFSFYTDNNLDVRRYFDIWQGAIMNFSNNTCNFYNEYVSDVNMYIQDEHNDDVYGIRLIDAFPLGQSILDMSYSSENQFLNASVTFSYKYWLPHSSSQRISRS